MLRAHRSCRPTASACLFYAHKFKNRSISAGVLTATLLLIPACSHVVPEAVRSGSGAQVDAATAKVKRGDFLQVVRLHGTVESVQSFAVRAPRLAGQSMATMVVTRLAANGAKVRPGDVLVEFDRQNQMKSVLDQEAQYRELLEQIKKRQADEVVAVARDETELKGAEMDVQSALVDMRTNEVVSRNQAEINKQNLTEAEARLKLLKETLALKREASAADLRILEIQRDRAEAALVHARNNIEKMTIRSPLRGLVVLSPVYKASRYVDLQEGDEVRPGSAIMLVVDPSAMQVRARINQVDMSFLEVGQPADVGLDAYPDLVLPGVVGHLGAVGVPGSYSSQIRYVPALIEIRGSNPKLLPDLTAAVDVHIRQLENVLLLPREAIIDQEGGSYVEVVSGGRTEIRPVEVGDMNECDVVILSGVEEGTVVTRNPQLTASDAVRPPK
jgi:HlyD family secretion protein